MIVKTKSLEPNSKTQFADANSIFQVPQTVKLSLLTPKKHISEYLNACTEIQLKSRVSRTDGSSISKIRGTSPLYSECPGTISFQSSKRIKQYNQYLQNYVKTKNLSCTPVLKFVNPLVTLNSLNLSHGKNSKNSQNPQRRAQNVVKRVRPARFLSQEDIENHRGVSREKLPKYLVNNKEDLKILLENNHSIQMKNLEIEKVCRTYDMNFKRASTIKKKEWTWPSPESSPKKVKFKD